MGGAGLEPARPRLLRIAGRAPHDRVVHLPPERRPAGPGRRHGLSAASSGPRVRVESIGRNGEDAEGAPRPLRFPFAHAPVFTIRSLRAVVIRGVRIVRLPPNVCASAPANCWFATVYARGAALSTFLRLHNPCSRRISLSCVISSTYIEKRWPVICLPFPPRLERQNGPGGGDGGTPPEATADRGRQGPARTAKNFRGWERER